MVAGEGTAEGSDCHSEEFVGGVQYLADGEDGEDDHHVEPIGRIRRIRTVSAAQHTASVGKYSSKQVMSLLLREKKLCTLRRKLAPQIRPAAVWRWMGVTLARRNIDVPAPGVDAKPSSWNLARRIQNQMSIGERTRRMQLGRSWRPRRLWP